MTSSSRLFVPFLFIFCLPTLHINGRGPPGSGRTTRRSKTGESNVVVECRKGANAFRRKSRWGRRDAAEAGIRHVWLQQGAESPYVASLCSELGLNAVLGECILMFAQPQKFFHKPHRWMWGLMGKLPK